MTPQPQPEFDSSEIRGRLRKEQDGRWHLDMTDGRHEFHGWCDHPGGVYAALAGIKDRSSPTPQLEWKKVSTQSSVPIRVKQSSQSPEKRIGDTERDRVITALQEHFAAGRLTTSEMEQRIEAATKARVPSALSRLLADLPEIKSVPVPDERDRKSVVRYAVSRLILYVGFLVVLFVIGFLVGSLI